MTVYFTASIVGKKQYLPNYLQIIDILKSKNFNVLSDHIVNTSESQIRMVSKEQRLRFHEQLNKWINSCDFMIAETSFPSISVGYEIALALERGRPVLILYTNEEPPTLLAFHQDEKLICERYTKETLKEIIEDFINFVGGTNDTRFTFFVTSEISSYLDEVSREEKIPKSVYLRNLIKDEMEKRK